MSLSQLKLQATEAVAVTTHNTNDLPTIQALIYVGVGGDVKVDVSGSGEAIVFKNCIAGTVLPVKVDKVYTTGTSATNLVALY
jgi:hypothetical protein